MKYFHFFVLLIAAIITAGCVGGGSSHVVSFKILNEWGAPVSGATVTAASNSTTSSNNGISGFINSFTTGKQSGTTDSSGNIAFTMVSDVKYDLIITYQGKEKTYQIYPTDPAYILWFKK
jgi:uncharacterized GH25 family protein